MAVENDRGGARAGGDGRGGSRRDERTPTAATPVVRGGTTRDEGSGRPLEPPESAPVGAPNGG